MSKSIKVWMVQRCFTKTESAWTCVDVYLRKADAISHARLLRRAQALKLRKYRVSEFKAQQGGVSE